MQHCSVYYPFGLLIFASMEHNILNSAAHAGLTLFLWPEVVLFYSAPHEQMLNEALWACEMRILLYCRRLGWVHHMATRALRCLW